MRGGAFVAVVFAENAATVLLMVEHVDEAGVGLGGARVQIEKLHTGGGPGGLPRRADEFMILVPAGHQGGREDGATRRAGLLRGTPQAQRIAFPAALRRRFVAVHRAAKVHKAIGFVGNQRQGRSFHQHFDGFESPSKFNQWMDIRIVPKDGRRPRLRPGPESREQLAQAMGTAGVNQNIAHENQSG